MTIVGGMGYKKRNLFHSYDLLAYPAYAEHIAWLLHKGALPPYRGQSLVPYPTLHPRRRVAPLRRLKGLLLCPLPL